MLEMSARADRQGTRLIHIVQGGYDVSNCTTDAFTTLLGSCVATCLCDPVEGVGGINHFLLPDGGDTQGDLQRYGLYAMELLINALLKAGASKQRLQAKLFGGASMHNGLAAIGRANAAFALHFLDVEGIACVGQSLGGTRGRGIRYWPTTGRAQLRYLQEYDALPEEAPAPIPRRAGGDDVTFF